MTRHISWYVLLALVVSCVGAKIIAPDRYAIQFREVPNASPSKRFPLGTDELGRDRLARLQYGGCVSLLLAPAAAALSVLLAGTIGVLAGYLGGRWERAILGCIDLFLSLPWLFLLITVRAMLPLNVSPMISVTVTFGLLGLLGWAAVARVVCAGVRTLRTSHFMTMARATGCRPWRLVVIHLIPNLKSTLRAQLVVSIPVFILAEANLSILGLGVAEPIPSWGSLLRDIGNYNDVYREPWRLVPLAVLMTVVLAFQNVLRDDEVLG